MKKIPFVIALLLAATFVRCQDRGKPVDAGKVITEDYVRAVVTKLAGDEMNGRNATKPEDALKAADYIESQFKEIGLDFFKSAKTTGYRQKFDHDSIPMANVIGMLKGKSKPDEFVVFSAHYDHIGISVPIAGDSINNGADDDASGTAAVIALAKYFKAQKNNERSLIFVAFTGEEWGGYGSQEFTEEIDAGKVVAMFNIEMIGKIVLFGAPVAVKPGFKPDASRISDSTLLVMSNAGEPQAGGGRFQQNTQAAQLAFAKWEFCMKEGAIAVLEPSPASRLEDGTVLVGSVTLPYAPSVPFDKRVRAASAAAPKVLPQVIVADEHYNRMIRQIEKGLTVKLELSLETEFTAPGPAFNVIGEIEGTDLKDEVVMIGAHLDSWHAGTGATDNAAGSAVMMEAMRIIQSLGVKPRRTIRIGLWAGEEQGLIGSRNYVKRTFGERLDKQAPYDSINLKPAAEKFSVYFNMDNGTGKYRGVYLQGNEGVRPIFRAWLKPFEKLGASTLTASNTGATDHIAFDAIGLPGFQFIQDPIEYSTRTHHTSMDVYDKLVEGDLKHNAVMTASFAWLAANRDQKIPRK